MKCQAALLAGRGESAVNTKALSGLSIWQTNGLAAFLTKPGPGVQSNSPISNSPQQIAALARSARLLLEVFLSGFC